MELFAGVPGFNDQFLSTSGFYVGVNNNSESIMTDYVGNIIPVGSSTWIAIRKEVYSKLEYPYSNCTRDIDDQTGTNDQEVGYLYSLFHLYVFSAKDLTLYRWTSKN